MVGRDVAALRERSKPIADAVANARDHRRSPLGDWLL
jgi:hypothetical protein